MNYLRSPEHHTAMHANCHDTSMWQCVSHRHQLCTEAAGQLLHASEPLSGEGDIVSSPHLYKSLAFCCSYKYINNPKQFSCSQRAKTCALTVTLQVSEI